jgi:hypothetical protein
VADVPYEVRIGPSSGTTQTAYNLNQDIHVDLRFVALSTPMHAGGPDIPQGVRPESGHNRRVRESLDRSIRENAPIWRELSKR